MSDPTQPSLTAIAEAGHTFLMPWTHQAMTVTAGFESNRILSKESPWVLNSPFDMTKIHLRALLYELNGGTCSFKDAFSTHAETSTDHLSVAGQLSVGPDFLQAEASGKYTKTVMDMQNGILASRNASCRSGRIILEGAPSLSQTAIDMLSDPGSPKDPRTGRPRPSGVQQFRNEFGDFYISGYVLGADAGALLAADTKSHTQSEATEITVKVKVVFFEASKTWASSSSSSDVHAKLDFCGYSTLEDKSLSRRYETSREGQDSQLRQAINTYFDKVRSLERDVRKKLLELKLKDGQKIQLSAGTGVCESGLVAQLILSPFARLPEYVEYASMPNRSY
ncbi:hypothetical protein BU16DRAFT_606206 [Lophium mytilinum]|uniref:MACPF domain-containing protein n=1 Tax=Lophium mytilinum TaxID=390894 RepID=A0A6A6QYV9_9PEZI|nr:hypothetical protein BU16DRAFT_606206 [Lophium mytilinum]